jgi:hypothetical protein
MIGSSSSLQSHNAQVKSLTMAEHAYNIEASSTYSTPIIKLLPDMAGND